MSPSKTTNYADHQIPGGWLAEDAKKHESRWIYHLSGEEIEDIDQALQKTLKAGHTSCGTMKKADFPLTAASKAMSAVLEHLEHDMGLYVLRGLPTTRYTTEELRMIYWGIGLNLGTAVSQSSRGDILGDVKNFGDHINPHTSKGRGYMSKFNLDFHTDSADVVGLMVIQTAKKGGLSMVCSSIAVRNEIARTRPDLLEILYEPFYMSWKGQEKPGEVPYYQQPVFSEHEGHFACRYIPTHIISSQDFNDVPRLTEKQLEAIRIVETVARQPKFHFAMMFEPGDIQFLNNHVTYHARTEFEDDPKMSQRRHLLRLWLAPPNSRPLSPLMYGIYPDQKPGVERGGFPSRVGHFTYETVASDV